MDFNNRLDNNFNTLHFLLWKQLGSIRPVYVDLENHETIYLQFKLKSELIYQ